MGGKRERAPASISSLKMEPCTLNKMYLVSTGPGNGWSQKVTRCFWPTAGEIIPAYGGGEISHRMAATWV